MTNFGLPMGFRRLSILDEADLAWCGVATVQCIIKVDHPISGYGPVGDHMHPQPMLHF